MYENLKDIPSYSESLVDADRAKLEEAALSIIQVLSDQKITEIMEELR